MTERKAVPLAYVTKWAATRGILVVMDAETHTAQGGAEYLTKKGNGVSLFISPGHWTDNVDTAEARWREAVRRAHKAAHRKAKALAELLKGPAKYERGTP